MALDKSARDLAKKVLGNPDAYPDEFKSWLVTYIQRAANLRFSKTVLTGITGESWHECGATGEPALAAGVSHYGNPFNTPGFYKDYIGIVHLKGLIALVAPYTLSATIFTLPAGYRPAAQHLFAVEATGNKGRVDVLASGAVVVPQGFIGAGSYIQLDGLTFRAA